MPGVKLEAVQEAYEQWNYSQQSLSPVASAIIAIALAAATGGDGGCRGNCYSGHGQRCF